MNSTVEAAIVRELATLTRVVDPPTGDLLYGRDLSCVTDLEPTLEEIDQASPRAIVQAVIRRFITPRGTLLDDPDYGLDVRGYCNRGVTQRDLRALSGALRGEAQKDDRVARADVSVTATNATLSIQVFITPADPALQDFSFTFSVTSAEVLRVTING